MSKEKQHIWDDPKNVRRFLRVFYVVCAGLFLADFVVERHVEHPWEGFPAFYAIYGFVACVALVLIATQLRKILMRSEDYYDDLDH